tara:strand:- start:1247 stop:3139 length:1893 start_codon:yes stop_codon:yes gene_type:complete
MLSKLCFGQLHYLPSIRNQNQFNELEGRPNTSKFGQVRAVKVLLDIKADSLYFINANHYKLHIDFCKDYLGYDKNGWKFNVQNYNEIENRDYLMATINYYQRSTTYTLEFSVADNITPELVSFFYRKITPLFKISQKLNLFLNTSRMRTVAKQLEGVPFIDANEIYKGQDYQALNAKNSYGYLRFIDVGQISTAVIDSKDIVVINGTPNSLPPVAGVVSTDFQTPLSHITILCQNRGTPMMALKKAWADSALRALEGQSIRLQVGPEDYQVDACSPDSLKKYFEHRNETRNSFNLRIDTSQKDIVSEADLGMESIHSIGGKAARFGQLKELIHKLPIEAKVPESAFAVPFHFYIRHIERANVSTLIDHLPKTLAQVDLVVLRAQLEQIQHRIKNTPVSKELLEDIDQHVLLSEFRRFRFRSSTNAEDLEGFNGAGLYDSKTGMYGHSKKTFEKAIQKVWASAWNYSAFMERSYFGIDQKTVAMGILCHRSFPDEKANGVVITKNLYRPNYRGFVINSQVGETSVVNPPSDVTCEQVICYSDKNDAFYGKKEIVEYLSYSNITPEAGGQVLKDAELVKLTRQLAKIKKHLYYKENKKTEKGTYYDFGLDFEFKLYGETRTLYLKQMRPFSN